MKPRTSIRRNATLTLGGHLATLGVALATIPAYIRALGDARYGVLLLVWVLLGYFSLFDIGLGQATNQRMATLRHAPAVERSRLLWTAVSMTTVVGVLAIPVLLGLGWLVLDRFVPMDPALRGEALAALPWMAVALPVTLFSSTLTGAIAGREAFAASTLISTGGQVLAQVVPLAIALRWSPSLALLVPAAVLSRVATAGLAVLAARKVVPLVGRPVYDAPTGRSLLRFGSWVTVSSIVGPIMSGLDRVLVGGIAGAQSVTYFGVPSGLATRILTIPTSLAAALFPRLAASDDARRQELSELGARVLACILTPIVVAGLFLVRPFLAAWVSPEFSGAATPAAWVILVGVWANGIAFVAHAFLQARGRPDVVAKAHLLELPVYAAALTGGLWLWGIVGAAAAWTFRATLDAVILFALTGFGGGMARRLLAPATLVLLAAAVVHSTAPASTWQWAGAIGVTGLATAWSAASFPWQYLALARGRTGSIDP